MKISLYRLVFVVLFATISLQLTAKNREREFAQLLQQDWKVALSDSLTRFNPSHWQLDGVQGTIQCGEEGLTLQAGKVLDSNDSHVVLWSRTPFVGDIRVEYDFTRLDRSKGSSVNILYMHAQGSEVGLYSRDIMEWCALREVAAMRTYFNNMNLYHISYAVTDYGTGEARKDSIKSDYVRARRYHPVEKGGLGGTNLTPEYAHTGLFQPDVTYHISVILSLEKCRLYMEVSNEEVKKLFWFDLEKETLLHDGYLGFRQMWERTSRYKNLEVYQLTTEE